MTHLLVVYTDNFLRPVHMVPTCQKIYIKSNPVHGKISRNITIFSQLDSSKSTKEKIHRISWEPLFEKLKQVLPSSFLGPQLLTPPPSVKRAPWGTFFGPCFSFLTGCLLTGLFEHEIENKLQHYFSK